MLMHMPAIDADAHVNEDPFLLTKRAPDALRERLPQEFGRALGYRFGNQIAHSTPDRWQAFDTGGWDGLRQHIEQVEGGGSHARSARVAHELFPGAARYSDGAPWAPRYPELPEHYDEEHWYGAAYTAEALRNQGFDRGYMYPSVGLYLPCFDGMGELGIETCRIYNDWLREFCDHDPDMLRPVAMVSLHVIELAVQEIERVSQLGFKGIVFSRFPDGRTSADADLEPVWAACERLGLVACFHPVTSNSYLSDPPPPRRTSPFEFFNINMFGEHFANLWLSGVLERHPDLKVVLLESGCGWLPSVLWRLDRMFYRAIHRGGVWSEEITQLLAHMSRDELGENIRMPPAEYFARQCWIACEAEPFVTDVADLVGADRLVFQGDFPHPDHHPDYIQEFTEIVPSDLRAKILWDNPIAMYEPA